VLGRRRPARPAGEAAADTNGTPGSWRAPAARFIAWRSLSNSCSRSSVTWGRDFYVFEPEGHDVEVETSGV
jgi:hypothetical protein